MPIYTGKMQRSEMEIKEMQGDVQSIGRTYCSISDRFQLFLADPSISYSTVIRNKLCP